MDFNIEVRKKQLENLDQFIASSRNKAQSVLEYLGWNSSEVKKETNLVSCSINSSHKVPPKSLDHHVSKCSLKANCYNLDDDFLSEPTHPAGHFILIDDLKKKEIFSQASTNEDFRRGWNCEDADPKTSDRLMCTYTPDERLALYDYVVQTTSCPPSVPDFNVEKSKSTSTAVLSYEELLAHERDVKRRRMKYKSVHTNRKSHTEVLREVIKGQMELYEEWLQKGDEGDVQETAIEQVEKGNSPSVSQYSGISSNIEKDLLDRSTHSRNSTYSGSSKSTSRRNDYDDYKQDTRHKEYKKMKENFSSRRDSHYKVNTSKHNHYYKREDSREREYRRDCNYKSKDRKHCSRKDYSDKANGYRKRRDYS